MNIFNYFIFSATGFATKNQLGMQKAASPFMEGITDLHETIMFFLILISVFVIGMLVLILALYSNTYYIRNSVFLKYVLNKNSNFFLIKTRTFLDLINEILDKITELLPLNVRNKTPELLSLNVIKERLSSLDFLKFTLYNGTIYDFKNRSTTLRYNHGTTIETIGTVLPAIILLFIAYPSFVLLYSIEDVAEAHYVIKVIGHQGYGSYEFSYAIERELPDLNKPIIIHSLPSRDDRLREFGDGERFGGNDIVAGKLERFQKYLESDKGCVDLKMNYLINSFELPDYKNSLNRQYYSGLGSPWYTDINPIIHRIPMMSAEEFASYENLYFGQIPENRKKAFVGQQDLILSSMFLFTDLPYKYYTRLPSYIMFASPERTPTFDIYNNEFENFRKDHAFNALSRVKDLYNLETYASTVEGKDVFPFDVMCEDPKDIGMNTQLISLMILDSYGFNLSSDLQAYRQYLYQYFDIYTSWKFIKTLDFDRFFNYDSFRTLSPDDQNMRVTGILYNFKKLMTWFDGDFATYSEDISLQYKLRPFVPKEGPFLSLDSSTFEKKKIEFLLSYTKFLLNHFASNTSQVLIGYREYDLSEIILFVLEAFEKEQTELHKMTPMKSVEFSSYMVPEEDLKEGDLRLLEVDNVLYVPIHSHIHFLVTSADVLHSGAIPSLGIKVDAVPGRLNQVSTYITQPGVYYGQCSEICGVNHAFMPIKIIAFDPKNGIPEGFKNLVSRRNR